MAVLQFDCQFAYGAAFQLRLQFELEDGVTALVGPSGVGKTTTLQLIAGLLQPTHGRIVLDDRVLCDVERRVFVPPEHREIGLVPQDYLLFPHLTVEQNLRYGLRRNRRSPFDYAHLVDVLELGDLQTRYPAALSGGQRQRVAIGRAILRGPRLLLLDEPLSALDDQLKQQVVAFLRRTLSEYPVPTLLVSHDQASVETLVARRVVVAP
ncbi:MAG: ATP-binding cassette domain-containing protein [Pirellulales bacterium]